MLWGLWIKIFLESFRVISPYGVRKILYICFEIRILDFNTSSVVNNLQYIKIVIANIYLSVNDMTKSNPFISKWLNIYKLYGWIILKTVEILSMRIIMIKYKLQLGFETITYFIIYLAWDVMVSMYLMNILETSYKLKFFYYSYVQDYFYKIGKTNYHLQVRTLPQSALVHTLSWSVDWLVAVPHLTKAHCHPSSASLLTISSKVVIWESQFDRLDYKHAVPPSPPAFENESTSIYNNT